MSEAQRLINASNFGDPPGVEAALAAGADVHARGDWALELASERGHLPVVRCLLAAGADARANSDGPLRRAARNGHHLVVDSLIAAGANVHANTEMPLRLASRKRHTSVVERLLAAGADRDAALACIERAMSLDTATAAWLQNVSHRWQAQHMAKSLDERSIEGHEEQHQPLGEIGL